MNESDFRYVDAPTPALDDEGYTGVAWVKQSSKDVFFQLFDPEGEAVLAEPINVSRSPDVFSWLPRILIASADPREVHVLWQEIVFSGGSHGGETFYARSTDGGRTFGDPLNLSNTPAGAAKGRLTREIWDNGSLDLAMGPGGELYAAWSEYEGTLWLSRSVDGGESFSDPVPVAQRGAREPARGPSLTVGPEGAVHLVWTVGEDRAADLRFATSLDGGRSFGEPRVILESGGHSDAPKIAAAPDGTLHLVYGESPDGPRGTSRVLYARSRDGGRTFEQPREISDPARLDVEADGFPALALAGASDVYVLWELFPRAGRRPEGLGFTVSTDGGETFSAPAPVPGTSGPDLGFNGSLQGLLQNKLAANEAGALAVVNSTFLQGEESRVRLLLGRPEER
jgi:hypothetical protein